MAKREAFTRIDPELLPVFEELRRREPIFHTLEFGATLAEFERAMAPSYWEVGASGQRYSREFILHALGQKPAISAASAGWEIYDHGLQRLSTDTYLFTYTLKQAGRLTRRATIWHEAAEGWRILYHQGTVVSAEEDDTMPS
jgi:hypothetical protein